MIGSSAHNIARFCYHVKQKANAQLTFFLTSLLTGVTMPSREEVKTNERTHQKNP
nr:MAG TPA: hypothetical protein [Caudoviricetes sp.]